ncbi:MAG: hypothetical protein Q8783_02345, partial [Candidatus Phytoplasma stylosanthis]|nr:hypothetical protein [Candidatus Phytoplasma stylosanthis]
MNNLKKLIKEIIFLIIGVMIVFAPIYFIKKHQDEELHQSFIELDESFVRIGKESDESFARIGKKLDEARKQSNDRFAEVWENLAKLNKILNES